MVSTVMPMGKERPAFSVKEKDVETMLMIKNPQQKEIKIPVIKAIIFSVFC